MKVAVAGASGVLGQVLVRQLEMAGHQTVPLSRNSGTDLTAPTNALAHALDGVDCLVDVTNTATLSRRRSIDFFTAVTSTLLRAEATVGVGHHIAVSITGIDTVTGGYYAGKVAQENLVQDRSVPWTIVRSTQLHEFAEQILDRTRVGPVHLVPRMLCEPVAAVDVAHHLIGLIEKNKPSGTVTLGGPQTEQLPEMARLLCVTTSRRQRVIPVWLPGHDQRAIATGALRAPSDALRTQTTFAQWLRHRGSNSS